MPFSVALDQPRFSSGDDGGMGDWSDILTNIVQGAAKVGTAYLQTQQPTQVQAQIRSGVLPSSIYQAQPASGLTSSPMFLPLVGGLGLLLVIALMKGKR
jgi:hypothetical protein